MIASDIPDCPRAPACVWENFLSKTREPDSAHEENRPQNLSGSKKGTEKLQVRTLFERYVADRNLDRESASDRFIKKVESISASAATAKKENVMPSRAIAVSWPIAAASLPPPPRASSEPSPGTREFSYAKTPGRK